MNFFGLIFAQVSQATSSTPFFWYLGFIGLFLILVQGVFTLIFGHHGDLHSDGQGFEWSNFISLKAIAAMFIGVGFGGAALAQSGFSIGVTVLGGICIGFVIALFFVLLMSGFHSLRSDGTVRLQEAIGQRAKVYIRIPGEESAPGEIQVGFAGRMLNVPAFTRGPELPTGADVLVVSVHGEHALEVEKVSNA